MSPPILLFEHPLVRALAIEGQGRAGPHRFLRLEMGDWVNVVAITADRELVLVRQHRWGIGAETLEIVGGLVDPGETPTHAALRELREETGYGGDLVEMGWVWSNPAIQSNRTWLFAVDPARLLGAPEPDETEDIEVVLRPLATLPTLLDSGEISHSLAVVALQRWWIRFNCSSGGR